MSVQILLSTHNGESYLSPLLESLLAQDYARVSLLVRDDGSTDNTLVLLREYANRSENIEIVHGAQLGFVESFFTLVALASSTVDYMAFCDQDDIWQPGKISRAVEFLARSSPDLPALYCSRLAIVNESLKLLRYSDIPKKGLSFRNALVENQVIGCTSVFNQAARRLLARLPSTCVSHDWWIYLTVSAFGTVMYDREPRILYRQHGSNVLGTSTGSIDRWRNKIRQYLETSKCKLIVKQVEEFQRLYGASLNNDDRKTVERFLEGRKQLWHRLRYAVRCDVYRQSTLDQYILKARIALDRL